MNYYKIKVQIQSNDGDELQMETHRNFTESRKAHVFASGFANGFAMAYDGAILDMQIEQIEDDRRQQTFY
jgi:maltose-binding protein MalE